VGGEARVDPPIKIMIENKIDGPITYDQWIDLGYTIIPCKGGMPEKEAKGWSHPDFSIKKEEWKNTHPDCEIALRLDNLIDLDIDNSIAKRFVDKYIITCGAISGRPGNPKSHYWWKGQLKKATFSLPKDLKKYYEHAPHGATLCEIRSGNKFYTIVPGSLHNKNREYVRWEHYDSIKEYPGDLNKDLRKIALSTALCILYAPKGSRDEYCTAIAGVLIKQTNWKDDEINDFIDNLAVAANDDEAESRKSKGTTARKANRIFGMPKLAEILECEIKTIAHLFSWIGADDKSLADVKVIAEESIGDIIEYGQDRYKIEVTGKLEGQIIKKTIIVDGPTLMNQKAFYDAVISQAQVWIPKMKVGEFETYMRMKFETRIKSKNYVEEANEDLVFVKHFTNYIKLKKAFTDKKELANYSLPWFNKSNNSLEFNLDQFEDYLQSQKVNLKRVDLVLNIQDILKAQNIHGKYKGKSLVSWRVENPELAQEDIILEGEYTEETEAIDFEKDRT